MITLKQSTVEELRKIIKENYSRDLSFEEAAEIASTLVEYFEILTRAQRKQENKNEK